MKTDENITPDDFTSSSPFENLKRINPQFTRARGDQIGKLAEWDSAAKLASTGIGYTAEDMETAGEYFERRLNDQNYEVLVITVPTESPEPIGEVIVNHQPRPDVIHPTNHAEPFLIDMGNQDPLSYDTLSKIFANDPKYNHRAHIDSIATNESSQGKGVGKIIFAGLIDHLKSEGIDVVTFDTGVENIKMQRLGRGFTFLRVESHDESYPDEKFVAALLLKI